VVSEQEETIFDMAKEAIEPLQKQPNDVFATLLATAETIETTPKPIIDETVNTPLADVPVTAANVPLNSLITDGVIEHIEAQHEQFWTANENRLPTETNSTTQNKHGASSVNDKPLIYPVYTDDYFLQQGEKISANMPVEIDSLRSDEHRSLMVMMSFSEWLLHFKSTVERQKEESKDQRALKSMWQKEKLAAAIEEENEEIPENVFEMAVNSITREDGLMSESLAEIYVKQGKLDKAVEMYRKLSLRNPQKNAYFADKIKEILKENQS
jgi:tetratricopeptide (TPR) repeat protein